MAKSCKCKKAGECEECPEWIFTFADLVMLMMGFFVILFVLKPEGKKGASSAAQAEEKTNWLHVVGEIRRNFDYQFDPNSKDPVDVAWFQWAKGKDGAENDHPRDTAPGIAHDPTDVRPGKHTVIGGHLGFDAGSATLRGDTQRILDETADVVRGHTNIILVKGHTALDDFPDNSSAEEKMALSLRRAQAVEEYLIAKGVLPEVIRIVGCSTFEPVRQQAYDANLKSDNRRVEIETTSEVVDDRKDSAVTAPAAAPDEAPPQEKKEDKPAKSGSPNE